MIDLTPERLKKLAYDRSFTSEELIEFTGVDKFTFRNWLKRGVIELGERLRVGRWLFSAADMIRVSAMVDLVENIGMSPSAASGLCAEVVKLLDKIVVEASDKRTVRAFEALDRYVIVAIVRKGEVLYRSAVRKGNALVFDEDKEEQKSALPMLRVTHVVVAAGLIVSDILEKAANALTERASE